MQRVAAGLERRYLEYRRNAWLHRFAIFCRVVLALGFIPAGFVKVTGERFTGLPANHPLGQYFDALLLTGFYYTFIGVGQLVASLLLLIPRTALLGALFYFPIMVNIFVLTHATRFNGTRLVTLMLLANVFLLLWDYGRLKYILATQPPVDACPAAVTHQFPSIFFAGVAAAALAVILLNDFLFDIRPGNDKEECVSGSTPGDARRRFCDCIYDQGNPLKQCLNEYRATKPVR